MIGCFSWEGKTGVPGGKPFPAYKVENYQA